MIMYGILWRCLASVDTGVELSDFIDYLLMLVCLCPVQLDRCGFTLIGVGVCTSFYLQIVCINTSILLRVPITLVKLGWLYGTGDTY